MNQFLELLDIRPESLIGRDPAAVLMDVSDESMTDDLTTEMRALAAMVASHAIRLPIGRARDLAVEMCPLLCSLAYDAREIDEAIELVHAWIVGLGDPSAQAALHEEARLAAVDVVERNALHGRMAWIRMSREDREALKRYDDVVERTTLRCRMDGWSISLEIASREAIAVVLEVQGRRGVIGVADVSDRRGPSSPKPKVPELAI